MLEKEKKGGKGDLFSVGTARSFAGEKRREGKNGERVNVPFIDPYRKKKK